MLVILSGVAGAGKDTIKRELIKRMEGITTIPSYTDRPPREGDRPAGEQYIYVTKDEFERGETYISLMKKNVKALKDGVK